MRTPHPARLSPLGVLSCKHPDPDPDYNPYSANLAGVHDRSHVPSQSFSKAAVLTIALKVLGMLQHTNPLSLN